MSATDTLVAAHPPAVGQACKPRRGMHPAPHCKNRVTGVASVGKAGDQSMGPQHTGSARSWAVLTLLALQGHPGLQIVHLHLQPLEGQVVLSGLALVGDEDDDDDDEEQAASGRDADDGRQGQEAV